MLLLEQFENLTLHPKNAARLKELVLQLAVQGKLTENWRRQNPDVEPTAELLKRIDAEKAQLVKEKKIKKEKPLEPITADEVPYILPEGWMWVRLNDLAYPQAGFAFSSSKFNTEGDGLPIIRIRDIDKDNSTTFYDGDYREEFVVTKGDYLIGMDGVFKVAKWRGVDSLLNQRVSRLIFFSSDVQQALVTIALQIRLNELQGTKSYTTVDHLSGGQIKESIIPLPPIAEQEAMVARVEELMQKIEELEKQTAERIQLKQHLGGAALQQLIAAADEELEQNWLFLKQHFQTIFDEAANVKKLRETILQLAVQGKLTANWRSQNSTTEPASELLKRIQAEKAQLVKEKKIKKEKPLEPISEDEVPYTLPEGWVWCRLGEACLKVTDGTHHSPPNIHEGAYKYVTAKNIKNYGVELSNITYVTEEVHNEIYSRCNPEKGDLLYIKDGATTGIVTINNLEEPFSMLSSVALLKLSKDVFNKYLMYLMRSPFFYEATRSDMAGVAITRVTLSKINSSLTPLPPLLEQEAIVAKVDQLMQLCDELEQQIEQSKQEAEALMQAVVQEALQVQEEVV